MLPPTPSLLAEAEREYRALTDEDRAAIRASEWHALMADAGHTRARKTLRTKASNLGHTLGEWQPGRYWGEALVTCTRCDLEGSATKVRYGGEALLIRQQRGQPDVGYEHRLHALATPCCGVSAAERGQRQRDAAHAAYRARFEWTWLRAGEALVEGVSLRQDLEVRLHWIDQWGRSPSMPPAQECYASVEIPDMRERYPRADGTVRGQDGTVQAHGPTVDAALEALRAKLAEELRSLEQKVTRAVEHLRYYQTYVADAIDNLDTITAAEWLESEHA